MKMKKMYKILYLTLFSLPISACGADSNNQSNLDITGSWQRDNIPHDHITTDNTWTFKNDGTFSLYSHPSDIEPEADYGPSATGIFEIGSEVTLASGETAANISIHYDISYSSTTPGLEPSISDEAMPDIAYIQDETLYLGKRGERMLEACSAILLTDDVDQNTYINQYLNDALNTSTEQQATCYTRPTELDFYKPLYKLN